MTTNSEERLSAPTVEQRLLDAGIDLWTSADTATLFGGLTISSLAKAAGVTRATFYSYWPTTSDYMSALLVDLNRRRSQGYSAEVVKELSTIQSPNSDVLTTFMAACNIRFSQTIADPALRVRFGFVSKLDEPEVAEGLNVGIWDLEIGISLLFSTS